MLLSNLIFSQCYTTNALKARVVSWSTRYSWQYAFFLTSLTCVQKRVNYVFQYEHDCTEALQTKGNLNRRKKKCNWWRFREMEDAVVRV